MVFIIHLVKAAICVSSISQWSIFCGHLLDSVQVA